MDQTACFAGQTGFVKAIFDPKDRPGYFDKTITVFSNAKTPIVELKIKGTVEGRTRTVLDEYPYELASGLRFASGSHFFDEGKERGCQRNELRCV